MPPIPLETLYRDHRHAMWNAALHLAGDPATAEDVIHEVFVALARRPRELVHPRTYLLRAVVHRVRDRHRAESAAEGRGRGRGGQHPALGCADGLADVVDPAPGPALAIEAGEEAAAVSEALVALPLAQREVVVLHAFEGMSFRAIGELCGAPLQTVASRWRYACAALRAFLAREGIHP